MEMSTEDTTELDYWHEKGEENPGQYVGTAALGGQYKKIVAVETGGAGSPAGFYYVDERGNTPDTVQFMPTTPAEAYIKTQQGIPTRGKFIGKGATA